MSKEPARGVVVGASTGVGRQLALRLAEGGARLVLVARGGADLDATAADIGTRFGNRCFQVAQDIGAPDWDVAAFSRRCIEDLGGIDFVAIPAGASDEADVGPNPDVLEAMTATNYLGPARVAATFAQAMTPQGHGTILFFSSIAAAAPRSRNAAYAAAKAALEAYALALRHSLEPRGLRIGVVALGYVDTAQTFGKKLLFPCISPEAVAARVLRHGVGWAGKRYLPGFWWYVTLVLRLLPWFVYRRLSF